MTTSKKTFAQEFAQALADGYLAQEPHTIQIINETILRGEGGNLTRLFDKIQISQQTADLMYQKAVSASNSSEHIHDVIREMAKEFLNSDMKGLSDIIKKTLPEEQYNALVERCGTETIFVDYLLKAAAVSYIGILSAANDRAEETQQNVFTQQIWPLLSPLSQELNKDKLFPSLYAQISNFLLSLFPSNASQEKRAAKLLDIGNTTIQQLEAHLQKHPLNDANCNLIKQSIKEIKNQMAECQTVLDKYEMLSEAPGIINETSAKHDLNNVGAGIAKAMEGLISVEKESPNFLSRILNTLKKIFSPKTQNDNIEQIPQSLKYADAAIREKMHEIKIKNKNIKPIKNDQEIELVEENREGKHP